MQSPPDHCTANHDFSVENVAFGFDDESALGFEVLGNRTGDFVILEVHVMTAPFAHRGFRADRNLQGRATVETGDRLSLGAGGCGRLRRAEDFLNAKMLTAFLA